MKQIEFRMDLIDYKPTYKRNDRSVYFDPIRRILVQATPEEEVRQKFIQYLMKYLNVPEDMIDVEVHMTYFKKGIRDRADIVGYYQVGEKKKPLFVVECKAPKQTITDDTFYQIEKYDKAINTPGNLIITNGERTVFYVKTKTNTDYEEAVEPPTYNELISNHQIKTTHVIKLSDWHRPKYEDRLNKEVISEMLNYYGWIGEGTDKKLYGILSNLIGLNIDLADGLELPLQHPKFDIVNQGMRRTSFGNAAGGSWPGRYRYFILKDKEGNNQIISTAILGEMFVKNDPVFGNTKGHTKLIVAIDNFETSHNSLQLDLDKNIVEDNSTFSIYHDGTLTSGKSGAVSKFFVVDFVKEKAPHLLKGNSIYLGTLPKIRNITWSDAKEFYLNLIEYALLRDEIRNERTKRTIVK